MRLHLIAICGTGMGALAGLLRQAGHDVRGSDDNVYPPMSDFLTAQQIPVMLGYRAENLDWGPDRVVVGNACRRDHLEVLAAQAKALPLSSFPATLAELFLAERHPVVVAGTHGKTTTTSLVAWLLHAAGRDPGFLVGGITQNFGTSFQLGSGAHFVVEGDEYDTAFFDKGPKFLHYQPRTLLVTGIEFDHADIYPDLDAIVRQFERLVRLVPAEGTVLLCADDPRATALAGQARARVWTYGLEEEALAHAREVELGPAGTRFELVLEGRAAGRFHSPLAGRHNLQNAVGALACCTALGIPLPDLRAGLEGFAGVRRRQEVRGVAGEVTVIDDFAHHPTAVRETVAAVRAAHPRARVFALFEPRTNTSRRAFFQNHYAEAFGAAHVAVIASPFRAEALPPAERFDSDRLAADLRERGIDARHLPRVEDIVAFVAAEAHPGDVVLCMSNGGFGGIHERLLAALEERAA